MLGDFFRNRELFLNFLWDWEFADKLHLHLFMIHGSNPVSYTHLLIQSSINSFGSTAMAGNTASMNIENFIYISMNTFQQTAMSFTSQNYGAGEEKRIHKVLFICQGLVISVGLIFGVGAWLAGDTLLSIYSSDPNVIQFGKDRMAVICTAYFLCGIMDLSLIHI